MARSRKSAGNPPKRRKFREQASTVRTVFRMGREMDTRLVPWMLGALLLPLIVFVAVGLLLGHPISLGILGLMLGMLAMMFIFGRRLTRAQINQIRSQPGAPASIAQSMRGTWKVYPAVAITRDQDMVHRVLGRPGVILLGEGNPNRLRNLLGQEKRRLGRVVGDVPIYDVVIGEAEGQVSLERLQKYLMKLPPNIRPYQVNDLDRKLQALPGTNLPMPKGPLPKGARLPKGTNLRMR